MNPLLDDDGKNDFAQSYHCIRCMVGSPNVSYVIFVGGCRVLEDRLTLLTLRPKRSGGLVMTCVWGTESWVTIGALLRSTRPSF